MKKIVFGSMMLVLAASFPAMAGGSLQVLCDDDNPGAEVFLNGKSVGNCPVEVPLTGETVQLRARKVVDSDFETVFATNLKLSDGASQRVELVMSEPQLTAEAKLRREAAKVAKELSAANGGNVSAMRKLAQRYDAGAGVEKDPVQAAKWRQRAEATTTKAQLQAANAGDAEAMKFMAIRYEQGLGVEKDPAQANFWREKAAAAKK